MLVLIKILTILLLISWKWISQTLSTTSSLWNVTKPKPATKEYNWLTYIEKVLNSKIWIAWNEMLTIQHNNIISTITIIYFYEVVFSNEIRIAKTDEIEGIAFFIMRQWIIKCHTFDIQVLICCVQELQQHCCLFQVYKKRIFVCTYHVDVIIRLSIIYLDVLELLYKML